ncbi:hypothetical protein AOXY_G7628 [Acipenser oxyrinchus oxyrinchus]|uniref:Uncharacterized protein n=1 Tax=Acipenser oxyrinchus oxyrinchus TaxID=40147 RepID=A0AAD8GAH6_ACIOX|nr:hypothetical protein AOXY_G7628 [Acipenser oxyrinchus oxyrinchus]
MSGRWEHAAAAAHDRSLSKKRMQSPFKNSILQRKWLVDVNLEEEKKDAIHIKVKEPVVMEAYSTSEEDDVPTHKYTKFFSSYKKRRSSGAHKIPASQLFL